MKSFFLLIACSFLLLQKTKSQTDSLPGKYIVPEKIYKVGVDLKYTDGKTGLLMAIKDSALFIYDGSTHNKFSHKPNPTMYMESSWQKFDYEDIKSVHVRNHSLRTWLVLGGMVTGIVSGILIGAGSSKDGLVKFGGAIVGGILGGGVGAVTGLIVASSIEKKYQINGEWKSLEELKATLKY